MAVTKWKPGATTLATTSYHQLPATRRGRHRHRHIRSPLPAAWAGLGECHNNFLRFQQIPASSETRSRLTSYAGMSSWFNWDARYYLRFSNLHISSLQLEMLKIFFVTRTWHVDGNGWGNFNFPFKCTPQIIQGSFTYLTIFAGLGILSLGWPAPGSSVWPVSAQSARSRHHAHTQPSPAPAAGYSPGSQVSRHRKQDILCRYLDHCVINQPSI